MMTELRRFDRTPKTTSTHVQKIFDVHRLQSGFAVTVTANHVTLPSG
jgi:hypothetical protein